MEATPFHHHHRRYCRHHSFLSDQSFSFPTTTTTTTAAATSFFDGQLNAIEVTSGHSNQASSSIDNKIQSSNSSISMVVHDHHKVEKKNMATTNLSSSFNEAKSCKRWRKEKRSNNDQENKKKKMRDCKEEGHIGYIHVRARRGEATDRHSLAERVRREKISEKMKALQAIVPGCDKITGKAVMLDEVINYVQFLQNEIEVLSSKLASVSPMLHELGVDFEAFMFKPRQNMITNQQQIPSFQEYQMASMVSENNGDIMWGLDPFAISDTFDSFY